MRCGGRPGGPTGGRTRVGRPLHGAAGGRLRPGRDPESTRARARRRAQRPRHLHDGALPKSGESAVLARLPLRGDRVVFPEARRQSYGGAVVDSSTSKITGGFAGAWSNIDTDGINRTWTNLRLALAYPLGDKLAFGATGRYLRVDQAVAEGPLGASLASDGTSTSPILSKVTFDAGLTVAPIDALRIGVVGHNLTDIGNALAPTTVVGGIGYTTTDLILEADGMADFTTWGKTQARVMAGGELFLADHFPIRLGYRYDEGLNTHAIAAGLGYIDQHWSFEVSGRHDIVGHDPATMLSVGLRYFYDATQTQSNQNRRPESLLSPDVTVRSRSGHTGSIRSVARGEERGARTG